MLESTHMLSSLTWHLLATSVLPATGNIFVAPEHQISDLGKRQAVTLSQEL